MKALSLWQPWATLVALGEKRIETRSWPTSYRGPLAIHATGGWPIEAQRLCGQEPFRTALVGADVPDRIAGDRQTLVRVPALPLGAVVATCRLRNCLPTTYLQGPDPPLGPYAAEHELAFGDYTVGRWAWVLADVRPIDPPIPTSGARGLWNWEPPAGLAL